MYWYKKVLLISFLIIGLKKISFAQSILPPVLEWNGKSETLIVAGNNPWITPTEKSGFKKTPDYHETMQWLKKLADASPLLHMISIGKSPEGRDIFMIVASVDKKTDAGSLSNSPKPLLLVQAGIHAGEIDGKDAGMMLLRDISFGNKKHLLDDVNLLFIPILNVDGHERSSPNNRPNQRGPENMGWRTNSENLNLNRDYAKLDTKEIRAVIKVINEYNPLMYMDIHVTDGADYQYDITFNGYSDLGYSPSIRNWLEKKYKPFADKELIENGHIPGPVLFAVNDRDFSEGNFLLLGEPRFSNSYGDLRHLASVLVENHSLKPFRQRILGTYVLIESTIKYLSENGKELRAITENDKAKRETKIPLTWKLPDIKSLNQQSSIDSMNFLGIQSNTLRSTVTNQQYASWIAKPINTTIPVYKGVISSMSRDRPKAYWIPSYRSDIIDRLRIHGIKMEILKESKKVNVEMYRIRDAKFHDDSGITIPYEGHIRVTGKTETEIHKEKFDAGSARISTDQPLGDLAIILLEPDSPDSFFSWGFFYQIFQRTEYIEPYVMEPAMIKMLEDPLLKKEFEQKKTQDSAFASNPDAIYSWFYSKTKFYDDRYLLYPVGREM
jgi:hypothetical protein